jgi:DNA-binding transcriptional MerR regulator
MTPFLEKPGLENSMQAWTIGKAARQAGVGIDTVRFYERSGLLPAARRTAGGYRLYSRDDVDRLRFIRRAKTLGFTLEEISGLLQLNEARGSRAGVKKLAEKRLAELDQKLRELTAIRDALASLVRRCSGTGPLAGCPIIEGVLAQDARCHPEH